MQQARKLAGGNRLLPSVRSGENLLTRPQPERHTRQVKLLLILITCFFLSLVVVIQYSSLVVLNYRLSSARSELARSVEITRGLELEVARLGSIGRIEQVARDKLGLVEPEVSQIRVLAAGRGERN